MTGQEKILLGLMPFWDPLIPPMGIGSLKSFLGRYGYCVTTVDANTEEIFKEIHDRYFEKLKSFLPEEKRSHFYNIGNDVFRNHMMVHLHYQDEKEYLSLIKRLIRENFYADIEDTHVCELKQEIAEFYLRLEKYILDLLEKEKPTVLGLSVFQGTAAASMFAFKVAKQHYPAIKTIMGGGIFSDQLAPGSPNFDRFLAKAPYIDKFIVDEGEILFLKYLQGELPDPQRLYTLKDIGGEILDISMLPAPDFGDMNVIYYPNLAAYTSRGCPYTCRFCSETVRWGKYRKKKAAQVIDEMMALYKQYGAQLFLMTDSLLNPTASDLAAAMQESPAPFYWDGYLRVDPATCESRTVTEWRRGGFYRARLGVESGSQHVLDLMNKKISVELVKETLYNLASAGIKTTTYWVIGYPGETEEDFQQTLALVDILANDIYEAEYSPFTYFYTGQVNSDQWSPKRFPLYPEEASDMLVIQSWELSEEPSREERYQRVKRFHHHCKTLGIPNPYSLYDISKADSRWKKLHKNAVPAFTDFRDAREVIHECRHIETLNAAQFSECDIKFEF